MAWECSASSRRFYAFPKIDLGTEWKDDKQFVVDLLNTTGVLTVHGSGFGTAYGSGHLRIVYLPQENVLEKAMDKLERFVR